jgi:hypothetical protein
VGGFDGGGGVSMQCLASILWVPIGIGSRPILR